VLAPRSHPPSEADGPGRPRGGAVVLVALACAAALLTGCTGKGPLASAAPSAAAMRVGHGVTGDRITVAALTDLSGPYAPLGKGVTQAQKLYFDRLNAAGGVCGRKVELIVRDHGYDVRRAVAAYSEVAPRSAAIAQVIGSPITNALRPRLESAGVLTVPQAWAHTLLGSKYIQVVGTTYDLDMINGVAFLTEEKGLRRGDAIGHLFLDGDYGHSALADSRWAARQAGLRLIEQRVKAADGDMSAQAAAFRRAGVKAILVSVSPPQAASLVGAAAAQGLDVPFVAGNSAFAEQLLKSPIGPALEKNYFVLSAGAPMSADIPGVKALARDYRRAYRGQPLDSGVLSGYMAAAIVGQALKKACAMRDLSREGIVAAHRSTHAFDAGLGGPPQNYTQWTRPGSRASYVLRPDRDALGGLTIHREPFESTLAKSYDPPL